MSLRIGISWVSVVLSGDTQNSAGAPLTIRFRCPCGGSGSGSASGSVSGIGSACGVTVPPPVEWAGAGRSPTRLCRRPRPAGPARRVTSTVTIRTGGGGVVKRPTPHRTQIGIRPASASARSFCTVRARSVWSTSTTTGGPSGRAHATSSTECRCCSGGGNGNTLGARR